MTGATPVTSAEFAALMAPLGPFSDIIAVGCSGGPDSLALTRLADAWARGRGASVLALVVEHGLRAESAAEASALAEGLAAEGIASRVLPLGLPAGPGLQERARRARRAALLAACRREGVPHLLLGHHADDQAETVLFRALRGSGEAGLAGMAALTVAPEALVLRPLLRISKTRLAATLRGWSIRPVQDSSNTDPRFARARLRAVGGASVAAGGFARRRARQAECVARRLAEAVRLLPEGCAEIAPERLGQDAVARRLMAALIRAVGGGEHAPSEAAVAFLLERGCGSLGGALWLRGGRWLVPEAGAGPDRFRLTGRAPEGLAMDVLGPEAAVFRGRARHLPAAALAALPAFRGLRDGKLVLGTHLAYLRPETAVSSPLVFAPPGGPVTECHLAG